MRGEEEKQKVVRGVEQSYSGTVMYICTQCMFSHPQFHSLSECDVGVQF